MIGAELGRAGLMQVVTAAGGLSLAPDHMFVYL
jgi:hypothetical protein